MSKFNMSFAVGAAVFGASVLFGAPAHAHIVMKGALLSRDNNGLGNAQKMFPCDGVRGAGTVYTFEPGATIKLEIDVSIAHPSYYRIAFDNDGQDNFIEPASIDPSDPNRAGTGKKCLDDPNDKCGKSDFCNVVSTTGGASVLWDNLDPHVTGPDTESWVIKLPDVECDNCTLQVLQVMEDSEFHGPYCPTGSCMDNGVEDIYHRCVDIKLVKGAPKDAPGTTTDPVMNNGIECAKAGGTPTAGAGGAAGSSAAGSGGSTEVTPAAGTGAAGSGSAGSSASAGSSGSSTAGTSGGAGAAGGVAMQGAGGTPSNAGRAATAPPSSTGGAAGTPATTPTSGSAGKPAVASSVTAAGTPGSSTATPAPASGSSGGCSTAASSHDTAWGLAWSLGLLAGIVTRRKRRAAR